MDHTAHSPDAITSAGRADDALAGPPVPPRLWARASARTGRIYYYGDFRQYRAVGGRVEALQEPGRRGATQNVAVAVRLYTARALAYERRRRRVAAAREATDLAASTEQAEDDDWPASDRFPTDRSSTAPHYLRPMIAYHLARKGSARGGRAPSTVRRDRAALAHLLAFCGNCRLSAITAARLEAYVQQREVAPGLRPGTSVSAHTIRNELHALSSLYRRAIALGVVRTNPVAAMIDKPRVPAEEAEVLTRADAARLLDAAATLDARGQAARDARRLRQRARAAGDARRAGPARALRRAAAERVGAAGTMRHASRTVLWLETVVAVLLYTGGRVAEVLGLLVEDIDWKNSRLHFRPNAYRGLKRPWHRRHVELWPALAAYLQRYLAATGRTQGLLFAGRRGQLMVSMAKPIARAVRAAGLGDRRVTPHTLRHTYATMLLQTLVPGRTGRWAVRSSFDVARHLGHRSAHLVDTIYGHLVMEPSYTETLDYECARSGRAGVPDGAHPPS